MALIRTAKRPVVQKRFENGNRYSVPIFLLNYTKFDWRSENEQ